MTKASEEMLEVGAASVLPTGVRPTIVGPLGMVSKTNSDKLRQITIMIYVNEHLANESI